MPSSFPFLPDHDEDFLVLESRCTTDGQRRRLRCISILRDGPEPDFGEASRAVAVTERTVRRWWSVYAADGIEGLIGGVAQPAEGRAPTERELLQFVNTLPAFGTLEEMCGAFSASFGRLLQVDLVTLAVNYLEFTAEGLERGTLAVEDADGEVRLYDVAAESDILNAVESSADLDGKNREEFRDPFGMVIHSPAGACIGAILLWRTIAAPPISPAVIGFVRSLEPFLAFTVAAFFNGASKERPAERAFFTTIERIVREAKLTETEQRVLMILLRTGTVAEAAEILSVSSETVKWHARHIYRKTETAGLPQLFAKYFAP